MLAAVLLAANAQATSLSALCRQAGVARLEFRQESPRLRIENLCREEHRYPELAERAKRALSQVRSLHENLRSDPALRGFAPKGRAHLELRLSSNPAGWASSSAGYRSVDIGVSPGWLGELPSGIYLHELAHVARREGFEAFDRIDSEVLLNALDELMGDLLADSIPGASLESVRHPEAVSYRAPIRAFLGSRAIQGLSGCGLEPGACARVEKEVLEKEAFHLRRANLDASVLEHLEKRGSILGLDPHSLAQPLVRALREVGEAIGDPTLPARVALDAMANPDAVGFAREPGGSSFQVPRPSLWFDEIRERLPEAARGRFDQAVERIGAREYLAWLDRAIQRSAEESAPKVTRKLIAVGGGKRPSRALRRFASWSGGNWGQVLVIGWASEIPMEYAADLEYELQSHFPRLRVSVSDRPPGTRAEATRFIRALKGATGVYLTGGDQARILDAVDRFGLGDELLTAYRRGIPFAGTSAGTAVLSERTIIGGETGRTRAGLRLLRGTILDQHFRERERVPRLRDAMERNPGFRGIGVDEDTALVVVDDSRALVVGRGGVWMAEPGGEERVYPSGARFSLDRSAASACLRGELAR